MVDGPFKAGVYNKVFFDKNPYLTEKDGAVYKEKSRSKSESDLKVFKPSSPPKTVTVFCFFFWKIIKLVHNVSTNVDGKRRWVFYEIHATHGRPVQAVCWVEAA